MGVQINIGDTLMSAPVAILDANVILPASLRDTLLRAAEKELFQVHWSGDILEEVQRTLIKLGEATESQAIRLASVMNRAFPSAIVQAYQHLIPHMANDPKDRHVLAAAIVCHAETIVTFNLKDFPQAALTPFHLAAIHPDQFLLDVFFHHSEPMAQIIISQAAFLHRPSRTVQEVLAALAIHAPRFVQAIHAYLDAHPDLLG
jgi:predicted nucleic acid-binding protein